MKAAVLIFHVLLIFFSIGIMSCTESLSEDELWTNPLDPTSTTFEMFEVSYIDSDWFYKDSVTLDSILFFVRNTMGEQKVHKNMIAFASPIVYEENVFFEKADTILVVAADSLILKTDLLYNPGQFAITSKISDEMGRERSDTLFIYDFVGNIELYQPPEIQFQTLENNIVKLMDTTISLEFNLKVPSSLPNFNRALLFDKTRFEVVDSNFFQNDSLVQIQYELTWLKSLPLDSLIGPTNSFEFELRVEDVLNRVNSVSQYVRVDQIDSLKFTSVEIVSETWDYAEHLGTIELDVILNAPQNGLDFFFTIGSDVIDIGKIKTSQLTPNSYQIKFFLNETEIDQLKSRVWPLWVHSITPDSIDVYDYFPKITLEALSGVFEDPRDFKRYEWVKSGGIKLFTQNLRYDPSPNEFCYSESNKSGNFCQSYCWADDCSLGRKYSYLTATAVTFTSSNPYRRYNNYPVCDQNTKIPTRSDFTDFLNGTEVYPIQQESIDRFFESWVVLDSMGISIPGSEILLGNEAIYNTTTTTMDDIYLTMVKESENSADLNNRWTFESNIVRCKVR